VRPIMALALSRAGFSLPGPFHTCTEFDRGAAWVLVPAAIAGAGEHGSRSVAGKVFNSVPLEGDRELPVGGGLVDRTNHARRAR